MLVEVRVPFAANLGIHVAVDDNSHNCKRDNKNVSDRGEQPEPFRDQLRSLLLGVRGWCRLQTPS